VITAILGTTTGAYRLEGNQVKPLGLADQRVSAVYAWPDADRILAGSYENGMFVSGDGGWNWEKVNNGFTVPCVRWLGDDPLNPGSLLAGTEPGRIFRSADRGVTWSELDGIRDIDGHENWYLPYSPRAGAVRNVYNPPGSSRYLASVEVGGLLESKDGGKTWTCRHIGDDTDIHFITGHPNNGDVLYAALGYAGIERTPEEEGKRKRGGLARSTDSGTTWTKLFGDYTRAVIVPPFKPEIVVAAPAPYVGREGRIEVSRDGGDTWEDASSGIETPMPDQVEIMVPAPDNSIWAICSGGRLLRAHPDELHWTLVVPESAGIDVEDVSFLNR
jgi:hypothetical protein